jgi:hypothetical protein
MQSYSDSVRQSQVSLPPSLSLFSIDSFNIHLHSENLTSLSLSLFFLSIALSISFLGAFTLHISEKQPSDAVFRVSVTKEGIANRISSFLKNKNQTKFDVQYCKDLLDLQQTILMDLYNTTRQMYDPIDYKPPNVRF